MERGEYVTAHAASPRAGTSSRAGTLQCGPEADGVRNHVSFVEFTIEVSTTLEPCARAKKRNVSLTLVTETASPNNASSSGAAAPAPTHPATR
jgi:hypothetical protein